VTSDTRHERLYRALLRAYPARFRESYEREMLLVFRDQQRDGATREAGYWSTVMADLVRSAPREWRAELHGILETLHAGVRIMNGMAIVAVLVAAFELFNAAAELIAGGVSGRGGAELFAIILAIVGPALLLVAGISLLRRGRAAAQLGMAGAVACIASLTFLGFTHPMLSGLAMLTGIGFPFALLLFLLLGRARGVTGAVTP
jgi:hypothetical protein